MAANDILPDQEQLVEDAIAEQATRRPPFKFSMIGVPVGSQLTFLYDEGRTCITVDDSQVEYAGEIYSLTGLAKKLLNERGRYASNVPGPKFFTYQGESLSHLRNVAERQEGGE